VTTAHTDPSHNTYATILAGDATPFVAQGINPIVALEMDDEEDDEFDEEGEYEEDDDFDEEFDDEEEDDWEEDYDEELDDDEEDE
jgi:hypothetical protein